VTEPFIATTGKCHQQRPASDKKTTTPLPQHHHTHPQQPPLPTLVTPPEDLQQTPQQQVTVAMRPVGCADLEDLVHLAGPLTEDAVLKCLQARFCASQFFVSTGMFMVSFVLTASSFSIPFAYFSSL
jgi:dachs protein